MSRAQGPPEWRQVAGGNVDQLDGTVLTKEPQHGRRQRTIGHDMLHEDLSGMLLERLMCGIGRNEKESLADRL
jgi:hypothetical protein